MHSGVDATHEAARPRVATRIGDLSARCSADVLGVVRTVEVVRRPTPCFNVTLVDGTGTLLLRFLGRDHVPGISPGIAVSIQARVLQTSAGFVVTNPRYEIRQISLRLKAAWLGTNSGR
jgi:hypothetical protein